MPPRVKKENSSWSIVNPKRYDNYTTWYDYFCDDREALSVGFLLDRLPMDQGHCFSPDVWPVTGVYPQDPNEARGSDERTWENVPWMLGTTPFYRDHRSLVVLFFFQRIYHHWVTSTELTRLTGCWSKFCFIDYIITRLIQCQVVSKYQFSINPPFKLAQVLQYPCPPQSATGLHTEEFVNGVIRPKNQGTTTCYPFFLRFSCKFI